MTIINSLDELHKSIHNLAFCSVSTITPFDFPSLKHFKGVIEWKMLLNYAAYIP